MGIRNNKKKLSNIFALHILLFCISVIITTVIGSLIMLIMPDLSFIRPANYYEKEVQENVDYIKQCEMSEVSMYIPHECIYVVYGKDYAVLNSNIKDDEINHVMKAIKENSYNYGKYYFKTIDRADYTNCVVGYTLKTTYAYDYMNKYFPAPVTFIIIIDLIIFIINVIVFSRILSKGLAKELKLLKNCSEKINMENLDFKIGQSNVLEIDEILNALDKMKNSLKDSLKHQWTMEEVKRRQMNALAHDIKTPLTIIKGNSELLQECNLNEEESYFNNGILNESKNIEKYLKSLLEMMNLDRQLNLEIKSVDFQKLIDRISESSYSLAGLKKIKFNVHITNKSPTIMCDYDNLMRALMNIISNAFDFCNYKGIVTLEASEDENYFIFNVSDNGRGFSKECLAHGTEQFFQDDKSRNSKNHYGMGLYIAKRIVELHDGIIILANSEELGGAKVTIKIPKMQHNIYLK